MSAPAGSPVRWPRSMSEIAETVRGLDRAKTVADVIEQLQEIQIELSGSATPRRRQLVRDGVGCFNWMYLRVTQRIAALTFADEAFVNRLAVVFAEFYLLANAANDARAYVSKAWEPLFELRRHRGIAPLQFAIAGMNAHINNDLAWALVQVWEELQLAPVDGPAYDDFVSINDELEHVQGEVRDRLERGFLRWLNRALGPLDDQAAGFSIAVARKEAWVRGAGMAAHLDPSREERQERLVGFASHVILEPHLDFR
jgi:hypothetical protein